MTEVEHLVLNVSTRGMAGTLSGLYALEKGLRVVVMVGKELIRVTAAYEDYIAALEVSTKSQHGALDAYRALSDFAYRTPYDINEVTEAFIRLTNFGLNPSRRALTAYGNISSATIGTKLNDVVLAVERMTMGDARRLKRFGIDAKTHGDFVTFTFQNVSTKVRKNMQDIEDYMIRIGENNFAGAMEKRMLRLSGAMSNMRDSWFRMLVAVEQQGPGNIITAGFKGATEAMEEFKAQLESGQFAKWGEAQFIAWSPLAKQAKESLADITFYLGVAVKEWEALWDMNEGDVADSFRHWPIYLDYAIKKMKLSLTDWFLTAKNNATTTAQLIKIESNRATQIAQIDNAPEYASFTDWLKGNKIEKDAANDEAWKRKINAEADAEKKAILQTHSFKKEYMELDSKLESDLIDLNTQDTIQAFEEKMAAADKLRKEYEADAEARRKQDELIDPLEKYRVAGHRDSEPEAAKKEKVQKEKSRREIESLMDSLLTERELLEKNFIANRELILNDTELTENQKTDLMIRLTKQREERIKAIESQYMKDKLDAASTFFGSLASVGSTFGEKAFQMAKGAAIAQATIKTYEAATAAYASLAGIPYVGPALGAAAAAAAIVAGAANIAQIKAQKYSGAYAEGGVIPAGKFGLVGEAGPEFVSGPAVVTSAAATRGILNSGAVTIHNYGPPVVATTERDDNGLLLVLKPLLEETKRQTKKEIASGISRGGTSIAEGLERTYGLGRRGT